MDDRRKKRRIPVMMRVQVSWEDETPAQRMATAIIEDKSDEGVCLRISLPIKVGTRLKIKSQREQFSGVVINSRLKDVEYILGIQRDITSDAASK